jgi:hypothetical protein
MFDNDGCKEVKTTWIISSMRRKKIYPMIKTHFLNYHKNELIIIKDEPQGKHEKHDNVKENYFCLLDQE